MSTSLEVLKIFKNTMEEKFGNLEVVLDIEHGSLDVKQKNTSEEAKNELEEAHRCWHFWWEWAHGMASGKPSLVKG